MTTNTVKEIVLPSGRFARMRGMTWWDRCCTRNDNAEIWIMAMATRVVTIDGARLTFEEAQEMGLEEANPIIVMVADQMAEALKTKGVS